LSSNKAEYKDEREKKRLSSSNRADNEDEAVDDVAKNPYIRTL
jgi:hypothetical protein